MIQMQTVTYLRRPVMRAIVHDEIVNPGADGSKFRNRTFETFFFVIRRNNSKNLQDTLLMMQRNKSYALAHQRCPEQCKAMIFYVTICRQFNWDYIRAPFLRHLWP